MREYPAYGRTIAAHIVRGQKPICIAVLLSARWRYFDHVPKVCIKPEEWRAGRYELGYLRRLHVVAVPGDDCEERQFAELLVDLMTIGPRWLWAYGPDGSELYAGDFAMEIAELALRLGHTQGLTFSTVKAARTRMETAQALAARDEARELEVISQRTGPDGAIACFERELASKRRVRELFSAPYQDTGESAAA